MKQEVEDKEPLCTATTMSSGTSRLLQASKIVLCFVLKTQEIGGRVKGQRLYLEEINWRGGSQFFELFFPIRARIKHKAQSTREGGDVNTKHKSNNLKSTRKITGGAKPKQSNLQGYEETHCGLKGSSPHNKKRTRLSNLKLPRTSGFNHKVQPKEYYDAKSLSIGHLLCFL